MAVADWRREAALPTAGVREGEAFEHTVASGLGNRRRQLSLSEPPTGSRRKRPNRRYASCRSSGEPPRNSSLPARVLTNWASPKVAMTSHSRTSSPNQPERFIATRYHGGVDKDRPIPGGRFSPLPLRRFPKLNSLGATELKAKLRWLGTRWATIPRIGNIGTKRSWLLDGTGVPLSLIVSGANRHDVKLPAQTLDSIVIGRPKPSRRRRPNLCADKG